MGDLGPTGGSTTIEALKLNRVLTYLDLSSNHLDAEVGKVLADAMSLNTSIEKCIMKDR